MRRINKLIRIGRFEGFIGRRPHWSPEWRAERVAYGYGLWLGHWTLLACWRKRFIARAERRRAEDAAEWPARAVP